MSEGGENDSFAEPLYGLTPVPRVQILPLRQNFRPGVSGQIGLPIDSHSPRSRCPSEFR
jgi:hypothetical protein